MLPLFARASIAAVLPFLAAAAAGMAAPPDLAGTVVDEAGKPVAGARVYVEDLPRGATTAEDGSFTISGVLAGTRTIVVESPDWARERRTVAFGPDTSRIHVVLRPNTTLLEAAKAYREPAPERMAEKLAYLDSLRPPAKRPPNIIFILFDDLGWGDLASYGNRLVRTPFIDAVAKDGTRLQNFYAASPVCSPSRASMLSGRYPERALAGKHAFWPDGSMWAMRRAAAGVPNALVRDEILLPEMLSRAGYRTAMVGKWHLGDRVGHLPNDFGFEHFYGVHHSNDMTPLHIYRDRTIEVHAADVRQDSLTERFTQEAIHVLRSPDPRPFFLYLPFTAPHAPHAASARHAGHSEGGTYGDVIEELDAAVGRVRAALKASGKDRDTLIVITSDNGADVRGDPGPVRGNKQETFEGGQRVPLIVAWPGRVPSGGKVRRSIAMNFDLMATFATAAGVPMPMDRIIDGRDLMPLIRDDRPVHDLLYYIGAWSGRAEAVRDAHFKFRDRTFARALTPYFPGDGAMPIYEAAFLSRPDFAREAHDLSARFPAERARLAAALARFNSEADANPRGWLKRTLQPE